MENRGVRSRVSVCIDLLVDGGGEPRLSFCFLASCVSNLCVITAKPKHVKLNYITSTTSIWHLQSTHVMFDYEINTSQR